MNRYFRPSRIALALLLIMLLALGAGVLLLERLNIPPRQLAPYLEHRAAGHQPAITALAALLAAQLQHADRGPRSSPSAATLDGLIIGAQTTPASTPSASVVEVASVAELNQALAQAAPGQAITLRPGRYRIDRPLSLHQSGSAELPIVLRAAQPGTVFLEINTGEGLRIDAPWWRVENLVIQGVCPTQHFCEHALHVVGRAAHFTARNNRIVDFNAHFKINGDAGQFPDDGVIENNTLTNTAPRQTLGPVTPIDLVAASGWRIARNQISDFIKAGGDRISYGAFVKGGGSRNRMEQNLVLCEQKLLDQRGQQVGLSLGGGGTGPAYCRDRRCITEQDGGVIAGNLIAACSDDGIYLNRAAASQILHNTLIDTGGVTVRFPESSADVEGNLVDGVVRSRDEGLLRSTDNSTTAVTRLYLGSHPVRDLFQEPATLALGWRTRAPLRQALAAPAPDLCGAPRSTQASYGAFEDFAACRRQP